MALMAVMAPNTTPLLCTLALPAPSHCSIDATTLSPCWAPHFMTQEGLMFLNETPERATSFSRSDDERRHAVGSHCSLALHRASILQPETPPQVVAFES